MSVSGQRPSSGRGTPTQPRRGGKAAARQPNRAQIRAMEARAEATRAARAAARTGDLAAPTREEGTPVAAARARDTPRGRGRVVARPVAISREEEYAYIRADLNRLLVTAGALLVLMIALLFLIEG